MPRRELVTLSERERERQEVGGQAARAASVTVSVRPRCRLSDLHHVLCRWYHPRPFDALHYCRGIGDVVKVAMREHQEIRSPANAESAPCRASKRMPPAGAW
jgi:hypothetical protein